MQFALIWRIKGRRKPPINRPTTKFQASSPVRRKRATAYKQAVEAKKLTAMPLIKRLTGVGNERKGFFETEHFKVVVEHLPEYLMEFVMCGFEIGWRKGACRLCAGPMSLTT